MLLQNTLAFADNNIGENHVNIISKFDMYT